MPSPLTSSFASAAANNSSENAGTRWNDGFGSSEWSRNRANGATQTFRRTSSNFNRDTTQNSSSTSNTGVYIPPHLSGNSAAGTMRNGMAGEGRYNKEQMLSIYQSQHSSGVLDKNLDGLFLGAWDPLNTRNGDSSSWSKIEGKESSSGPEVCWDHGASSHPLGLMDMAEEERSLFSSSVNSPLKLQQNNPKENPGTGVVGGRKTSLSNQHQSAFNSTSGSSSRPNTRRRETSDSFQASGPLSPTGTRQSFLRDDPNTGTPPALLRRRTDMRDEQHGDQKDDELGNQETGGDSETPFASLKRSTTGPFSVGTSSPWTAGQTTSAFGPMGTFGSFAIGSSPVTQDSDKRPGFGSARGGSRFKDLLSRSSTEELPQSVKQKASLGNLEMLSEDDTENMQSRFSDGFKTRPNRSETNPYEDMPIPRSGSAALAASDEYGSASQGVEQLGFSSFGIPPNIGSRDFTQRERGPEPGYYQTPQGRYSTQDAMSPTTTNPYQSPPGNRGEDDEGDMGTEAQTSGLPPFGSIRRSMISGGEDRSQTSSSSNLRGLAGLPGSSAWPTGATPARERPGISSAFGDPIFSPMSDLQSPGLGGLGGNSFFGGTSSIGRSSKLGALFPPAMQEQMRVDSSRNEVGNVAFGFDNFASARDAFDSASRRRDDAGLRSSFLDDTSINRDSEDGSAPFGQPGTFNTAAAPGPSNIPVGASGHTSRMPENANASAHGLSQSSGSSSSNQLPATQQRQMVMPDRMRWIYRDPQGNTQGPWSGLEMHDWFKAGFFTAELQVKKLEDTDYEPLAQLVRRIGNSREPFLVPQIGVPHGPAPSTQGTHWASPTVPGAAPAQGGNAQPPFASSFPSFGTTLTAEQQNALERRKQEEQFLMARQKEHLAQQQVILKQMQLGNGPHPMHSLQHHSSAHSLHSQPSFGSITSPSAYQPSPLQGPIQPPHAPGFVDNHMRQAPTSNMGGQGSGRDEEMAKLVDRMSFTQRSTYLPNASLPGSQQSENITAMLQDRARLQTEQQQSDMRSHQDAFLGSGWQNDRLAEFTALRGRQDYADDDSAAEGVPAQLVFSDQESHQAPTHGIGAIGDFDKQQASDQQSESLSLTQQVQRAAASQGAPETSVQDSRTSGQMPPLSISPLPAPAAQRNRQQLADALAAESRSATQTPVETPGASVAPWAEKSVEMPKGPSLREIQEAEARKAAEQEEIAAAARRAQAEQERVTQVLLPAPGLPATSTWGSSASPSTPTGPTPGAWAKGTIGKPTAVVSNSTKKTLAQIQKEEESRKLKAAAAAATAQPTNPSTSATGGKRYAELASKIAAATPAASSSAWTTVGSGGKAKTPATVVATSQPASRVPAVAPKTKPTLQTTRSTTSANQSKAAEEFSKWAKAALGKGLNNNINVEDFVQSLLALPPDIEIISDSVYANSQTLDGRRFAEEFARRRKLADKGIVEPANSATTPGATSDSKSSGGWSEVAKKGPVSKEENTFKVVPNKKKGRK